ncbi:MAG: DM13 domain-containing protein [Candidatus Berkelbacteria bacterium]|nr:DM13 domain-containing protein [Candidatus Berkelbacteria bacterium]
MKKILLVAILGVCVLLTGCSGSSKTPTATQTKATTQDIGAVDPLLTQQGFVRQQLTDPALFDYVEKAGNNIPIVTSQTSNSSAQKKIGLVANFQKTQKYGLQGVATVLSAETIQVKDFSYNGGCGPVKLGLTISNNATQILASVKEISQPVSKTSFDLAIPQNLTLAQFDTIAVYCPDNEDPVSSADLSAQ